MKYASLIDNVTSKEWNLNIQQAYLFDWIYALPSWATKVFLGDEVYFFASRTLAIKELPLLTDKPDTMYRYYKQLEELDLIVLKRIEGKDCIALTEKAKLWGKQLGNKSEPSEKFPKPEINPNELGKESESGSENNPTYNTTNTNQKTSKQSGEITVWPSFDDFWDAYDKKVDRKSSEKKWAKISQPDREKIMAHVPGYVLSTPDKKYRKDPETYLNRNSWENEIIQSNGSSSEKKGFDIGAAVNDIYGDRG
jgi:hypothetical protein